MSIGETLASARRQAGLTVTQLSQRTRIRETIIRGIEQDDYAACGGDFYTRGHIRAMARAVGADPVPLIREFDGTIWDPYGPDSTHDGSGNVRVAAEPSVFDPLQRPASESWEPDEHPAPHPPWEQDEPATHQPAGEPAPYQPSSEHWEPDEPTAHQPTGESWEPGKPTAHQPTGESWEPDEPAPYQPSVESWEPAEPAPYQLPSESWKPGEPTAHQPTGESWEPGKPAAYQPLSRPDAAQSASGRPEPPFRLPLGEPETAYPASSRPEAAYPAPSVFDAVDEVPHTPAPGRTAPPPRRRAFTEPPPQAAPESGAAGGGGMSWISRVFDGAPEEPGEITAPNIGQPRTAAPTAAKPRRENRLALTAVAVLAVIGVLAYLLTYVFSSGGSNAPRASATAGRSAHPRADGGTHPAATPTHSSSPASPPATVAPQPLHPVSAQAFGPSGVGQGDNPQYAAQAIDHSSSTAWESDWYNSSHFGNLQSGTGLLLDMGRTVTITSAEINLGSDSGAGLQLRAGFSPSLAALTPVATTSGASGTLRLQLTHPARARYLLVWFTTLPQDSAGTYQAQVYNITLQGTR